MKNLAGEYNDWLVGTGLIGEHAMCWKSHCLILSRQTLISTCQILTRDNFATGCLLFSPLHVRRMTCRVTRPWKTCQICAIRLGTQPTGRYPGGASGANIPIVQRHEAQRALNIHDGFHLWNLQRAFGKLGYAQQEGSDDALHQCSLYSYRHSHHY